MYVSKEMTVNNNTECTTNRSLHIKTHVRGEKSASPPAESVDESSGSEGAVGDSTAVKTRECVLHLKTQCAISLCSAYSDQEQIIF